MEQQINKPFYKKPWVWLIGILVLFYIIGSASGSKNSNQTSTNINNKQAVQETTEQKQYVEIMKFSGNGQKKSEPFTITGSRFKITYDCKGDIRATYCGAFVYKVGSQLPQGVMNSTQAIKDETVIYTDMAGKGEYYIDANTMGNFSMVVYDYK